MDQKPQNNTGNIPHPSANFGTVPKDSDPFRNVRNDAEGFRSVPQTTERKENHTLTVREVARMFESAGVARTERSIVNWCQRNRMGLARLDSYFDPNERKYFIAPQSVVQAITEEKAKAIKNQGAAEPFGSFPQPAGRAANNTASVDDDGPGFKGLEQEILDLRILSQGKDYLIEELKKERKSFFDQLLAASQKVGELETRLLRIESPGEKQQN